MRVVLLFIVAGLLASCGAGIDETTGAPPREQVTADLALLSRDGASAAQINHFLDQNHAQARDFCAAIPEHPDCLRPPTVRFAAWQSAGMRVMAHSLRMAPLSATIHVTLVCLQAGTEPLRVQARGASGADLPAVLQSVTCPQREEMPAADLVLAGDYRFGSTDPGTAREITVDFPGE